MILDSFITGLVLAILSIKRWQVLAGEVDFEQHWRISSLHLGVNIELAVMAFYILLINTVDKELRC